MRGTNDSLNAYTYVIRLKLPELTWAETFAMAAHIADYYEVSATDLNVWRNPAETCFVVENPTGANFKITVPWLVKKAGFMMSDHGEPEKPKQTDEEIYWYENIYTNAKDD